MFPITAKVNSDNLVSQPRFQRPEPREQYLRIGFFSDTYLPAVNGITVAIELLASELRRRGHTVTIFAPQFPGFRDSDPNVWRVSAARYSSQPPVYIANPTDWRVLQQLNQAQFDVLHVHSPLSMGLLAFVSARAKHVPLVYTYHTSLVDFAHYLKFWGHTAQARVAAKAISSFTTNLADQVVTPSVKFEQLLRAQHVRRPIQTIPNGMDLGRFYSAEATGQWRERLGIAAQAPMLLSVGRQDPEKCLDFLLDAFAKYAAHRPDAHLVLAGDGGVRPQLEKQASASGFGDRIHFLGMVSRADLPGLLHEADVFVSASSGETQCLSMLESIAAGLPVVAVADDAYAGMLVDGRNGRAVPRDLETYVVALEGLLNDSATRTAFGRESVTLSRKFGIEMEVDAMVNLYYRAINRRALTRRAAHIQWGGA